MMKFRSLCIGIDLDGTLVDYAAVFHRLAVEAGLVPQAVGWAALGVSIAAYEQWLSDPRADLHDLLDAAYRGLAAGFAAPSTEVAARPARTKGSGKTGRTGRTPRAKGGEGMVMAITP